MSQIEKLTPEQEVLIPVYREKWRQIALSTERIDREKAAQAVKKIYAYSDLDEPEIIFCASPYAALIHSYHKLSEQLCQELWVDFLSQIYEQLKPELLTYLLNETSGRLSGQINTIGWQLDKQIGETLDTELVLNCLKTEALAVDASAFDYCISVLQCHHNQREWFNYVFLVQSCGWIFLYKKACIICDRPIHICFDNQNRLHAEGEPAIEYADGYSLYSYHGVTLPEKYGKLHPQQWEAQWLLKETNAELRRVLIQGIGYSRICQDLQAIELDNWARYSLLRIDNDFIDIEPILLLKMTCPSTGFIHVLRVPPNMLSAREAIRWVNWGIDPEDFIIET
ncbi:DUF6745 domain-containing protein [Nostoc sp. FACHB-280]|uniref:DUF6745 domain-containing protein n=1 Tax=Nostoc sp. FACHB-280 TaxID=2692839 RepID=UPI00168B375A|nr:hypothetical protein [Nostoc sp. FACHB-280]MBD2497951.1 hypothetical protein [Nostoc sp. FACHB-280]